MYLLNGQAKCKTGLVQVTDNEYMCERYLLTGHALGIWICGWRLFCKGGSKGGYRGGSIRLKLELGTFSQAKVNKVLNLDLQFFCTDFLGKL